MKIGRPPISPDDLIEQLIAGRTIKEAAHEAGIGYERARQRLSTFYRKIGARTLVQAVAMLVSERAKNRF